MQFILLFFGGGKLHFKCNSFKVKKLNVVVLKSNKLNPSPFKWNGVVFAVLYGLMVI